MKKRIVSFCLFLVFFVSFNAVAEIVTEPLTGVKLKWIINLHEPKESNIIVGTLEAVSSDAGNSICFRIRDVNGIEVYTSSLSGIFGGMEPLYDEEDNHIIGFRYFGSRSFSMALGTTEFWVVYMGVDLTPLYETLRWPVAPTKMYTPYSITSFDDGSYMTIGAENHKKICINHFNANDTMIGQEIKYLTVNSDSEEHFQLAGKLNVAKLSDNQIIIGANNNVDGIDKLSFFNINADGDHNISPLTSFGWDEWSDNRLGGVIIYQNKIIPIAESGGKMYGLILEPDFTEIERFEYSDFSDIEGFQYPEDPILNPFCASVNPSGLIYIGGRARYGTNIEKLSLCTVDVNDLSNKKIMIEDVTAVVMAVTWTPTGAVGGGSITDGPSSAFWFEYIPEPSNWYIDEDGDTFGNPDVMVSDYSAPPGYVADNTDCNDDPLNGGGECYPGNPDGEICGDGLDNDCVNGIDDGCPDPTLYDYYADKDGDKHGDPNDMVSAYSAPSGYVLDNTDCNDDPLNGGGECYPGNPDGEICGDGLDNDCANGIDDGCPEPEPEPIIGDFNNDYCQDWLDYPIIKEEYLNYYLKDLDFFDPKYDLNYDNQFNILDLRVEVNLINDYLKGGE